MTFKIKFVAVLVIINFCFSAALYAQIRRIGTDNASPSKIQRMINQSASAQRQSIPDVEGPVVEESRNNKVASLAPQPEREWVVMVYMNGKNDGDFAVLTEIHKMEMAGSDKRIAFVVEVGRHAYDAKKSQRDFGADYWEGNRRYFIEKTVQEAKLDFDNLKLGVIKSPLIFKKSADMGDVDNVISFGKWVKQKFPARKYMLVMLGHGLGYGDPDKSKGLSFDNKSGNYVRTVEITKMLKEMGGVDVFVQEACLMQMLEVLYQTRTAAKFIVGSEETLPMVGLDYTAIMKAMKAKNPLTPRELSKIMVDTTNNYYLKTNAQYKLNVTFSAVEAAKIPALVKELDVWTSFIMALAREQIRPAMAKIIKNNNFARFEILPNRDYSFYADLGGFIKEVSLSLKDPAVKQASNKVLSALNQAVVSNAAINSMKGATGIAIGLPHADFYLEKNYPDFKMAGDFEKDYYSYPFVKNSNWGTFHKWIYDIQMEFYGKN